GPDPRQGRRQGVSHDRVAGRASRGIEPAGALLRARRGPVAGAHALRSGFESTAGQRPQPLPRGPAPLGSPRPRHGVKCPAGELSVDGRARSMREIALSIPDEALSALQMTPEQFGAELRLAAAVKFYELGRLSSGAAARVAGIPRTVFLTRLADF